MAIESIYSPGTFQAQLLYVKISCLIPAKWPDIAGITIRTEYHVCLLTSNLILL